MEWTSTDGEKWHLCNVTLSYPWVWYISLFSWGISKSSQSSPVILPVEVINVVCETSSQALDLPYPWIFWPRSSPSSFCLFPLSLSRVWEGGEGEPASEDASEWNVGPICCCPSELVRELCAGSIWEDSVCSSWRRSRGCPADPRRTWLGEEHPARRCPVAGRKGSWDPGWGPGSAAYWQPSF